MRAGSIHLSLGCVLGLCALAAGCAGPVERRPAALSFGDQGGAWEVVFPAAQSAPEMALGPEIARRDASLNVRDQDVYQTDAWPDRPSLDGARRLFLTHRADELLYFRSERRHRARY